MKIIIPPPRGSTICLPDIATHDQISQAFPFVFAYYKLPWEQPGNKTMDPLHYLESKFDCYSRPCLFIAVSLARRGWL